MSSVERRQDSSCLRPHKERRRVGQGPLASGPQWILEYSEPSCSLAKEATFLGGSKSCRSRQTASRQDFTRLEACESSALRFCRSIICRCSIDLGHVSTGVNVLTYERCSKLFLQSCAMEHRRVTCPIAFGDFGAVENKGTAVGAFMNNAVTL